MEKLVGLDWEVFLLLNNMGSTAWDGFWNIITSPVTWIPLYVILIYFLYKTFGLKNSLMIIGILLLTFAFNEFVTNTLKHGIQRPRPCFTDELQGLMRGVACKGRGHNSFPSGHSSNHFAIALFLGLVFRQKLKWMMPALLIWAALIAYSRVYLGVHFPMDILVGALLGTICAYTGYNFLLWTVSKFPEKFERPS